MVIRVFLQFISAMETVQNPTIFMKNDKIGGNYANF